jgi:plastocyanin
MNSAPTGVPTGGPAAVVVMIVGQNGSISFSPNPVTLHVGAAIAWKNSDTIVHQIVQDSGGQASGGGYGGGGSGRSGFTTDQVTPGAMTSSITFTTAGGQLSLRHPSHHEGEHHHHQLIERSKTRGAASRDRWEFPTAGSRRDWEA